MDAATLRVADVEHKSADQCTCESELKEISLLYHFPNKAGLYVRIREGGHLNYVSPYLEVVMVKVMLILEWG